MGALSAAFVWQTQALAKEPAISPGMALPPEFLSAEAAAYEAMLDPSAETRLGGFRVPRVSP